MASKLSSSSTRPTTPKRPASGVFSGAGDSSVARRWAGCWCDGIHHTYHHRVHPGVVRERAFHEFYLKQTLSLFKGEHKPFLSLTLMQHMSAAVCGTFAIRVLKLKQYKSLPSSAMTVGFYRLIFVYTLGFCLTNGSFGKFSASLVDTIKAGEPIATVLLTVMFLPGER